MRRTVVIFAAIFVTTLALDQGTKVWAHGLPVAPAGCAVPSDLIAQRCAGVPQPVVAGYWEWELAYNTGSAFSFVEGAGAQVLLGLIAAIALVAIGVAAARTRPEQRMRRIAFAMIAGGALGNLLDRIRDGAVTDFVRWHVREHAWPVFNVADAALVIGIAILVADEMFRRRRAAT